MGRNFPNFPIYRDGPILGWSAGAWTSNLFRLCSGAFMLQLFELERRGILQRGGACFVCG